MEHRNGKTVIVWTALVAGAGWLLSGALYSGFTNLAPIVPGSVVRLVFPTTVPSWNSVMPWNVLIPALSTLTLIALVALIARFALPRTVTDAFRSVPTFLAVWLCIVLASLITSVLWSTGLLISGWPPVRIAFLLDEVAASLSSVGYWGILWGWIPALVAVLVVRKQRGVEQPTPHIRRLERILQIGITAILAAALVASVPLSAEANRAADAEAVAPTPTPTEPPIVYGSPTVSLQGEVAGADWCRGDQVAITIGGPDGATGHRALGISLVNVSEQMCVLAAYPDIGMDDQDGWVMDAFMVRGGSFMTTDQGLQTIILPPGSSAKAALGWNAMSAAGDGRVGTLLVAPYAGTDRQSFPVNLDIVNGGPVSITAWELVTE